MKELKTINVIEMRLENLFDEIPTTSRKVRMRELPFESTAVSSCCSTEIGLAREHKQRSVSSLRPKFFPDLTRCVKRGRKRAKQSNIDLLCSFVSQLNIETSLKSLSFIKLINC